MRLRLATAAIVLAGLVAAPPALAHVTLNPREAEADGFTRLAVRVPNERPDAATVEVSVRLPEGLQSVSLQPKPGWRRAVEREPSPEPAPEGEAESPAGAPAGRIAIVTWSGGRIGPGEFEEFGLSARLPDAPGTDLSFPALQTYSSGEVVRWIGAPDADEPAPRVALSAPGEAAADDGDARDGLTLAIAGAALALALGALALALAARRGGRP